jgi:hypothetical protein
MFRRGVQNDAAAAIAARGGKVRAATLSPERRKEIARAAAKKRWGAHAEGKHRQFLAEHEGPHDA